MCRTFDHCNIFYSTKILETFKMMNNRGMFKQTVALSYDGFYIVIKSDDEKSDD